MCAPLLAAVPAIVAGVGAATSTAGLIAQGVGAANEGAAAEAAGRRNQWLSELAAADAKDRGRVAAGAAKMQVGRIVGEQKAAYGASGVDANSGSPMAVERETRIIGDAEVEAIKTNAAREAWGYKTQGLQFMQEGKRAAEEGSAKLFSSLLNAGGSIAKGALDTYETGTKSGLWGKQSSTGLFGSDTPDPTSKTAPAPSIASNSTRKATLIPPLAPPKV